MYVDGGKTLCVLKIPRYQPDNVFIVKLVWYPFHADCDVGYPELTPGHGNGNDDQIPIIPDEEYYFPGFGQKYRRRVRPAPSKKNKQRRSHRITILFVSHLIVLTVALDTCTITYKELPR